MVAGNLPEARLRAIRHGAIFTIVAASVIAAIAYDRGSMGWSWDAINHHIYLGMIAESPRWQFDVAAAASQSYQYPYLYWPAYQLSLTSGSGAVASAVWAAIQTMLVVPPLWLLTCRMLPEQGGVWESLLYRIAGCTLALASLPVLAVLMTTANDALAALPLLWALALGIGYAGRPRAAVASAALVGIAIALKYSNVLFLPLLVFAWWHRAPASALLRLATRMTFALGVGFAVTYLPWGWQLWQVTGNPFYPHLASVFAR